MVSVVPAGKADRTPPRVMPKVFADVPTQKELEKADRARKAMGFWVVLLVLMLVGAGGLVGWEVLVGRPAIAEGVSTQSGKALTDVNEKLKKAEAEVQKQTKNNEKLSAVYEPFKAIATAEAEIADYKKQIDERLSQYPAARDRTRIEYRDHWAAYDSADAWKGANKTAVGQDLQNKSKLLIALLKKIDEIKPPTTAPGPSCTDATRCAPASPRPN